VEPFFEDEYGAKVGAVVVAVAEEVGGCGGCDCGWLGGLRGEVFLGFGGESGGFGWGRGFIFVLEGWLGFVYEFLHFGIG